MPKANCPVCDADVRVYKEEATFGTRLTCPECGAFLEVVEEDPLELEEVLSDERDEDLC
ncbi:MAG: lysine biosynthesis protein LysW [Candidatus Bipolaricaulaceae bacterium]